MTKRLLAEFLGTFWLVFGGCGSAVLAAAFPELGIGFSGVALAFGLTVLTMAYAVGGISGGHFNPAVSVGLFTAGRLPAGDLIPYIVAQVVGAIVASTVLYLIATGKADFTSIGGFATNGYGDASPGKYSLTSALLHRGGFDLHVPDDHPRLHQRPRARRFCADRHRPCADPDPPHLDPG